MLGFMRRGTSPAQSDIDHNKLQDVASDLAQNGCGIMASDESVETMGKRFAANNIANTEEGRRGFRELLYTANIRSMISGAIMCEETLFQKSSTGTTFPELLLKQGVRSGIKVDLGTAALLGSPEETYTLGLDDLPARCAKYVEAGATFAKWRAVIRIDTAKGLPTPAAVERNVEDLARYAYACQACGLVPIVEPEILSAGNHTLETAAAVHERVLWALFAALHRNSVNFEALLLKPAMVTPGMKTLTSWPAPQLIAQATLTVLRKCVPAAVPGVMFLSGGQSEELATVHLNAINKAALAHGRAPWALSFSFGRALQASTLQLWSMGSSKEECQMLLSAIVSANSLAQRSKYSGPHPAVFGF